jgi:phage baseplate assembly protein W
MVYEVTGRNKKINFGAIGIDEVLQNVAMILTTPKGSVPLRRSWFIDYSLLDTPMPAAQAKVASQIFQAIRTHEPRARIVGEIRFIQDNLEALDGRLVPAVNIEVVL